MGLFDKLGGIAGLIKFLSQVDGEDISKLVDATKVAADESVELVDRIGAALIVADVVTDYVPGEFDDKVVDVLKEVMASEAVGQLIAVISDLFEDQHVDNLNIIKQVPEGLLIGAEGEEAKAVPWPLVISVAVEIIKLLIELRGEEGQ